MTKYGYAGEGNPDPDVQALMDTDPTKAMKVGLMMFQERHSDWGLEMTGEMDDQTMELMCMGRCGDKDIMTMDDMMPMEHMGDLSGRRKKRYALGSKCFVYVTSHIFLFIACIVHRKKQVRSSLPSFYRLTVRVVVYQNEIIGPSNSCVRACLHRYVNTNKLSTKFLYVLSANRPWPLDRPLTYRITRYTPDLSRSQVDVEIARAFQVWADVTPLRFEQRTTGDVDIFILFAPGAHGDNGPFDGRGGVLAHAYLPVNGGRTAIEGDSHFDEAETWTLNTPQGEFSKTKTKPALQRTYG